MTIIGRSLSSRLFSTITTVLMVAVSMALMLVLLTMGDAGHHDRPHGRGVDGPDAGAAHHGGCRP
ncbi:MAG: hypothetical protein KC983_12330, partial [Phycisphaerales bacterium]|nr:hypothetical protein [Phycisphaerales bacterium]